MENQSIKFAQERDFWQTTLKDYEFIKLIGQGSTGVVMLAEDKRDNSLVAIKHMTKETNSFYRLKKALREVKILRKLTQMEGGSQHFTKLHRVLVDDSKPGKLQVFIVMDYIPNNLKDYLESEVAKELTVGQVVSIVY